MHWIQRHILKELAFSDTKRYSELKPDGVEGNLFQYHGRDLEKQGLIVRNGEGYALTPKGSRFVADLSQTKAMNRKTPPRVVVMVTAKRDDEYLLFRWRRHPYRNQISLPFGRQFAGQSALEVAAGQLRDKTGYQADLSYLGLVSLSSETDHLLIQVYGATNLRGDHGSDGLTGYSFWAKWSDLPHPGEPMQGMSEIMAWIEDENRPGQIEITSR